jgi:molybdopterin-synthase adenylyltransferase
MTSGERERYSRQILFPGIGEAGQERILRSRAVIVGCGALGTVQAIALARAGVGSLTIIDRDFVELSNLQRQWLFDQDDAEAGAAAPLPKAVAAERKLKLINAAVRVEGIASDLTCANIEELVGEPDVILDGADNFETRYLINDYAVSRNLPWIYGAAIGSYGIMMPVIPGRTACLRCLYPDPPEGVQPTCETAGVLGAITGVIASLQAADALKVLSGNASAVKPRITTIDVWDNHVRQSEQPPAAADCPACGAREFVYLNGSRRAPISLCGRNAVQIHERSRPLDLRALQARLAPLGDVRANEFALRFFLKPYEMTIFPDGRAIIKGTTDTGLARSLYAQYVGI